MQILGVKCSVPVINMSRLSDLFVGRMKAFLLVLNVGCVLSSYWFVIVAQQYVAFSRGMSCSL